MYISEPEQAMHRYDATLGADSYQPYQTLATIVVLGLFANPNPCLLKKENVTS